MEIQNLSSFIEFNQEKFTKRVLFHQNGTTVFVLNFSPGQTLPVHKHPGAHLQLLVLQGEGMFIIDDQEISVKKDDVLHVNGEENLSFTNNHSNNTSLYVVLTNTPNEQYAKNV